MLPILRIIPVGGVLLAIAILVLALSPPGGLYRELAPVDLSARGALTQLSQHPEWRQFLILAALRRAEELSSLRGLPDTPARDELPDAATVAGLPVERDDTDSDDETGSISVMPNGTIPIEIGEPSSTELPVRPVEERPPVVRTPERSKASNESRRPAVRRIRRAKAPRPKPPAQFNLFEALFGGVQNKPLSSMPARSPITVRAARQ